MSDFGFGKTPFLIVGPCAVEAPDVMTQVAVTLSEVAERLGVTACFKASFDKANRASHLSARGPGMEEGLRALEKVKSESGLPILTDIHEAAQAAPVAEVVDELQIPAFLCRQTDLLTAAGATGLPVNVKKGQWMSAASMTGAVEKIRAGGCKEIAVTERGTFLGYGDLVVDFRNLPRLRQATGAAIVFDATHSVQQPGGAAGGSSGGLREFIPTLVNAAAAAGVDGFFIESHPDPASALSDAATQWPLAELEPLVRKALAIRQAALEVSSA
jgi:2-dehydro-3-deoxyphosphooctonate aldolase (KDO 8-P synthase)